MTAERTRWSHGSVMLSLLVAVTLGLPTAPRAASSADSVVHIPRLDRLVGLGAFLNRAGEKAALLRPSAWSSEFHPLLRVDPTQVAALAGAGIDATGAATVSFRGDGTMTCTRVADRKRFTEAANAALAREGALKPVRLAGGAGAIATTSNGVTRAGYFLKGPEACAFGSISNGESLRKEALRAIQRAPAKDARTASLPGAFYLSRREGVVGLDGQATQLQAVGSSDRLPVPTLRTSATSPYANVSRGGLLLARASLSPAGVSQALGTLSARFRELCRACTPADLSAVASALGAQLTGHVLLHVENVRIRGSLREPEVRFFAPRQALAAEAKDEAALRKALTLLAKLPGVRAVTEGYTLGLAGGAVHVRQKGKHVVLGNDEAVTKGLLGALDKPPGPAVHGLAFEVSPRELARALSQISLLDLAAGEDIAALFAFSTEAGPLLAASERLTGWADSSGARGHRFSLTWTLPPPAP